MTTTAARKISTKIGKDNKSQFRLSGLRGGEFVRDVLRDAGLCSLVA